MCDLSDGFKLCTCDGEALADPDWVLSRWDRDRPVELKQGSMAGPPVWSEGDRSRIDAALEALDAGTCFDFDYTPEEGDVIVLRAMEGRTLRFRFMDGWSLDESTPFTPWRDQMVETQHGRLALSADIDQPENVPVLQAVMDHPADSDQREVAIDWLHEHGHADLAAWLRMEARAHDGANVEGFREAAERVGRRVRARFARGAIQKCGERGCPGSWQDLPAGSDELTRECGTCGLRVPFVDHSENYAANGVHVLAPSLGSPWPGLLQSLIRYVRGEG